MKKMKLAVAFAALVSVFGFSSCLNSDESGPSYDLAESVIVKEYMGAPYLIGENTGYRYNPTNSSVLASLQLKDGNYYKRANIGITLAEGEVITEGKTSYKISAIVVYQQNLIPYKSFNLSPDTLKGDYKLKSLKLDNTTIWARFGFVNVPFSTNIGNDVSLNDFHLYVTGVKEDTLYTRFRYTKDNSQGYQNMNSFISFEMPFSDPMFYEQYNKLQARDSIIIKVTANGENGELLEATTKYKFNER